MLVEVFYLTLNEVPGNRLLFLARAFPFSFKKNTA